MRKNLGPTKSLTGGSSSLTEVQKLEKESKEMELRLMLLKERISKDEEKETPLGGNWQSARMDKGSLMGYSRTILSRHKERTESKFILLSDLSYLKSFYHYHQTK